MKSSGMIVVVVVVKDLGDCIVAQGDEICNLFYCRRRRRRRSAMVLRLLLLHEESSFLGGEIYHCCSHLLVMTHNFPIIIIGIIIKSRQQLASRTATCETPFLRFTLSFGSREQDAEISYLHFLAFVEIAEGMYDHATFLTTTMMMMVMKTRSGFFGGRDGRSGRWIITDVCIGHARVINSGNLRKQCTMIAAHAISHIDIESVGLHDTSHQDHFFDRGSIKSPLGKFFPESLISLRDFLMAQSEIAALECFVGAWFA